MKETKLDNGKLTLTPETPTEEAALDFLRNNRPLFAVAEEYVVRSFIAGARWAQAQPVTAEGQYSYQADKATKSGGIETKFSAHYDTKRDATLAAKLAFNLSTDEYQALLARQCGVPIVHRGVEIKVNKV